MGRDLVTQLETRSVRRDGSFEEATGMLQVGDATSLYVMVAPTEVRSNRRVIVTDGLFEMFTLQRLQIDVVRSLAAAGVPAIYVQTPGMGDGEGDPGQILVVDRVQAVRHAADLLETRTGRGDRCFISTRLGGVVALRAADAYREPTAVCLWDPILDVRSYMKSVTRLERASAVLSDIPTVPPAMDEDGSWRQWTSSAFGVDATARQLEDFERECSRLLESPVREVEAFAVFVSERAAKATRPTLERLLRHVDVVTLGLRDPLQLGMRKGEAALEPTLRWITGRSS